METEKLTVNRKGPFHSPFLKRRKMNKLNELIGCGMSRKEAEAWLKLRDLKIDEMEKELAKDGDIGPGRELDILIAERVMKNVQPHDEKTDMKRWFNYWQIPEYSTDISSAWKVVNRVLEYLGKHKDIGIFEIRQAHSDVYGYTYFATFKSNGRKKFYFGYGENPAHAICIAALKANDEFR